MASDAFVVGEDWISEHYFNTESTKQSFAARVKALRKEWDGREDAGEQTPRSRLAEARGALLRALAVEDTDDRAWDDTVLTPMAAALGFAEARWHRAVSGPVTFLSASETPDVRLVALVRTRRVADVSDLLAKNEPTLLTPFQVDDDADEVPSVARALSQVFSGDEAPAFAVVLAGTWALVAERERWAEGRFLAVDLQLVLDRGDVKKAAGEFDRAVAALAAESSAPQLDGPVWWAATLEESVKHTVGVSKDLREGVRESIEIIANEVVRRRAAQGLDPLPNEQANVLARQSLRYLYRILFLLYAEASPEMRVLPTGAPEYALGYGLDRLRELVHVELGEESRHRTHLYASLATLFRLVDAGHDQPARSGDETLPEGLVFHPLNADLFAASATSLIDEVRLGDGALRQVLELLLLTREEQTKKGRDRGFISYADLGVTQLGAVYEGLMSYTGFFAQEDLFEVAPNGDGERGSWVVPVSRADGIAAKDFVTRKDPLTGEVRPRRYGNGEFVFRLSGRERQTSASFYTPEVLTKFVVSQALEELLDQDGQRTSAEQILQLSVCEPALGSGAFAIEAVRQLAEQYLTRREEEVGEHVEPDDRSRELQKAKAAIALHQVYGVDLNATAVELAEISLWLDTMVDGLKAPWFGLRLRRGNSLIGARRAVYSQKQVADKAWLKDAPKDVPVATLLDEMREGRVASATSGKIHHFLLPAEGWGAATDASEGKELAREAHAGLRDWRKRIKAKPTKKQLDRLLSLAHRVESLWQFTLRRLEIAEAQVSRDIELWNDPREQSDAEEAVSRADIEAFLHDPNGAYQRLRRVMDAWCALWFWPLKGEQPPSLNEWLDGLTSLIGGHSFATEKRARSGAQAFGLPSGWHALADAERDDLTWASALDIDDALSSHPWLRTAERVANEQGFFHWELDFAGVFGREGFDLQVGNPPWVRPDFDENAALAEHDVWFALNTKPSVSAFNTRRVAALALDGAARAVLRDVSAVVATRAAISSPTLYPVLGGLRPDLYRCFMARTWQHIAPSGRVALIHPESHFTDDKAGLLRRATYRHLRRHWQFVNELSLFEVHHLVTYGVHVYGREQEPRFRMATSLYHPGTVAGSLRHNGDGAEPGLKTEDGKWDLSAHAARITHVGLDQLASWHALLENGDVPIDQTRMVYAVNRSTAVVLTKLARAPRLGELPLEFSQGWNETTDFKKGYFEKEWGPVDSWDQAILQGPHLFVGNPFYKSPNATMLHNLDWSPVDLEELAPDALPVTSYKPARPKAEYDAAYTHWGDDRTPARSHYRIAWRKMTANSGERTLISAIIPPGTTHIDGVQTLGLPRGSHQDLAVIYAHMGSLVSDFLVRAAPKANIRFQTVASLARGNAALTPELTLRAVRLNAFTTAFAEFHNKCFDTAWPKDRWASDPDRLAEPLALDAEWTPTVPLRRASDRRQAQLEIDAIVALSLGVTADELCTIYRTQFPVLYGYDRNAYFYDANGRLVPNEVLKVWKLKGTATSLEERQAVHPGSGVTYTYKLPFVTLDREADMRQAYAHFEKILKERS